MNPAIPFCPHHQNPWNCELEEIGAAAGIEHESQVEARPRSVPPMRRRKVREERKKQEAEPESYGDSEGRPEKAQRSMVYEIYVQNQVDGSDGQQNVSRGAHDACPHVITQGTEAEVW